MCGSFLPISYPVFSKFREGFRNFLEFRKQFVMQMLHGFHLWGSFFGENLKRNFARKFLRKCRNRFSVRTSMYSDNILYLYCWGEAYRAGAWPGQ
jgi:hypothetical protein